MFTKVVELRWILKPPTPGLLPRGNLAPYLGKEGFSAHLTSYMVETADQFDVDQFRFLEVCRIHSVIPIFEFQVVLEQKNTQGVYVRDSLV